MAQTSATSNQVIALPEGGGAVQGIGETFQPDLYTGTGNFSVPIAASPGRQGFGPQLSLQYSTGNGNGSFGLGWKLSIPRITRKTEKGLPRYTDEDVFVLSGAEDLVLSDLQPPENEYADYTVIRYRPRTEGLFARIEKWTQTEGIKAGDTHWRIVTKDNIINLYGKSESARVTDPDQEGHVYEWLLEETFDNKGNHILYEYVHENPNLQIPGIFEQNRTYTQTYIRRILYGNTPDTLDPARQVGPKRLATHHLYPDLTLERHYLFELLFDYGNFHDLPEIPYTHPLQWDAFIPDKWPMREDPFSTFRSGFEIRTLRRCRRVLMLHHFEELDGAPLVRSTDFHYAVNPHTRLSMLKAVHVKGYRKQGESYLSSAMPPVEFGYSAFEPHKQRYQSVAAKGNDLPPSPLTNPEFSLVDLFGDALPDIVQATNQGYDYWRNIGNANIDRRHPQRNPIPSVSTAQPNVAFGDMGGDGLADIVVEDQSLAGFFESTPDGHWKPFRKFESFPSVSLSDPNVRLLDLTGDGLTDILMTRDHHFLWFPCLGEKGYGEPQHIERIHDLKEFPNVYFDDPSGRVRLADMTGDGLNDIVLVHNGRIDYWPNLGYGRFGKRITMAQAPRLPGDFNPGRLFFTDLDGTGCADLVYVDNTRVQFWFNQSGNGWSEKQTIRGTPRVSDLSSIRFADFLGTGTASLIWSYDYQQTSEGNYKVLDFCGGIKPHLLTEMNNNMGATTRVQYAPSTKFYLEDQKSGTPWATNLPFPVSVVEKTEAIDHIGKTKRVTIFKYHHGYYDGREREFRGFGRVDRCDTEEFEIFSGPGLHGDQTEFENQHRAHHMPPVQTKTWFHTGVYFDEDNISPSGKFYDHHDLMEAYRREFYQGDSEAFVPDGNEVEHSGTPHEAYRALRGAIIRTEVFATDGTEKAHHPYTVTENRYRVKELQPGEDNKLAVYLTTQKESISYHYERNPHDPRIGQNIAVGIDEYGQVTDSLSITYPRRQPPPDLPEQAELKAVYAKTDYINKSGEPDYYYLGVACQTRNYEVTGVQWTPGMPHLKADAFTGILAPDLIPGSFRPFGWQRPGGHAGLEKRIIQWQRNYFRADGSAETLDINLNTQDQPERTLNNRLPLGEIGRFALPYETYTAAVTDEILTSIFTETAEISASMLLEGGYHKEPDLEGYWWTPGGQRAFDPEKFYLPHTTRDPFAVDSWTAFDDYALTAVESIDALENKTTAEIDYRVLLPKQVTGPNGNHVSAAFDALGLVVGTAVRSGTGEGDILDEAFETDLSAQQLRDYFENPGENGPMLLAGATSRMIYDLRAYSRGKEQSPECIRPPVVATLSREIHAGELGAGQTTPVQHSFLYSDGFSRTVQRKVPAEPDPETPGTPRWVGTGTTVFNNKGKPVRQYEPFFSDTYTYGIEQHGVSPTLFYDPLERLVCTLSPDHIYTKVVFDPWRNETWDGNDTVLQGDPRSDPDVGAFFTHLPTHDYLPTWYEKRIDGQKGDAEKTTAEDTAFHANTPTVAHLDTLGRTFLTVADNGERGTYPTRANLDIQGNQLTVIDARDRIIMEYFYDLAGRILRQEIMDAGTRWTLHDVGGNPTHGWDSRNHATRITYDELLRPTGLYVSTNGSPEILAEKTVYGESLPDPEQFNHRGRVYRVYDGAGVITSERYDFKGNLLRSRRQLLQDYKNPADWSQNPSLEPEIFTGNTRFDALNRIVQIVPPHSDRGNAGINILQPVYNEANLLEGMEAWLGRSTEPQDLLPPETADLHAVENIDYDARGQRSAIEYGNNVRTDYEYDPLTHRLVHLRTQRRPASFPDDCPSQPHADWPGCRVQNLHYTYDPSGNITHIRDDAQQTIFFRNQRVEPSNDFIYDAVYRLIQADGREHLGQTNGKKHPPERTSPGDEPRIRLDHPGDGHAMGRYTQNYAYDETGNLLSMRHTGSHPPQQGWKRCYQYAPDSNRLMSTGPPENPLNPDGSCPVHYASSPVYRDQYDHDAHGNMVRMPHLPVMEWNFKDQLRVTQRQVVNNGGQAERTYYGYNAAGKRVRKVTERQNGSRKDERLYLGGFEIYRSYSGNGSAMELERETLHITDDTHRIAMVETKTIDTGNDPSPAQLIRYQLGNHLGSASLELDEDAHVISYEEYYPYGSSSYQAVDKGIRAAAKRYRYTGMERDEQTGLGYHGARYYACWLGRWTSADPAGLVDGVNLFRYSRNNPIIFKDPGGTDPQVSSRENPLSYHDPNEYADNNADQYTSRDEAIAAWRRAHGGMHPRDKMQQMKDRFLYPTCSVDNMQTMEGSADVAPPVKPMDVKVETPFRKAAKKALEAAMDPNANNATKAANMTAAVLFSGGAFLEEQTVGAFETVVNNGTDAGQHTTRAVFLHTRNQDAEAALELATAAVKARLAGDAAVSLATPFFSGPKTSGPGAHYGEYFRIPGQRTRPAISPELARMQVTVSSGNEVGLFISRSGGPQIIIGSGRSVPGAPSGPDIVLTSHTHPPTDPALFSQGDIIYFQEGNFPSRAIHQVTGAKWPNANRVLNDLGEPIIEEFVTTTVTQAQIMGPGLRQAVYLMP